MGLQSLNIFCCIVQASCLAFSVSSTGNTVGAVQALSSTTSSRWNREKYRLVKSTGPEMNLCEGS